MTRSNGGNLIVKCLEALGAEKAFGVPGESYLAVLDALHDARGRLDFVTCRQEGGASFMAAAYGKLTGRPGICFVTRGPGATNASIGVHTAMQDSAPMLLLIGQVAGPMRDREAFQEIDYRAFFGPIAKWATEIEDVDRVPEIISRAWTAALSGRPGPVVIALPETTLTALSDAVPLAAPIDVREPATKAQTVDAVINRLEVAQRPLILVAGGGWQKDGLTALRRFAEASDLPVVTAFRYHDLYDNHSETYVGEAGVGMTQATKNLLRDADLILTINVRFGEMTTAGYTLLDVPHPRQTLVHVHASDSELGKIYAPDLAIHAGPNAFAAMLAEHRVTGRWHDWRATARAAFLTQFAVPKQPDSVDMGQVMAFLQDRLPCDAILTNGAGNYTAWPNKLFLFGANQRLLAPQSGAMGYGVPAAIAAKITYPGRTVVCFSGDGDFQMTCQELGTAAQAKARPIILLLNNGIYGTIRVHQERHYPGRVMGTTLENPDFVVLAQSYGFHAERVTQTENFVAAFERALVSNTGAVLELEISAEAATPYRMLSQVRGAAT